jgi:hypothetical protein
MLLVGHDLTRQRRSAIKSQMRDRGEKDPAADPQAMCDPYRNSTAISAMGRNSFIG